MNKLLCHIVRAPQVLYAHYSFVFTQYYGNIYQPNIYPGFLLVSSVLEKSLFSDFQVHPKLCILPFILHNND